MDDFATVSPPPSPKFQLPDWEYQPIQPGQRLQSESSPEYRQAFIHLQNADITFQNLKHALADRPQVFEELVHKFKQHRKRRKESTGRTKLVKKKLAFE